ncbi:MAG: hypothetical protein LDL33_04075 [Desulfomonile sp.]|nr:hypothetical protein [Desulfomonile sp.]
MNETHKTRIRLAHWIEHNLDHLKGYEEAAAALDKEGLPAAANLIREAVKLIETANGKLHEALSVLPIQAAEASGHPAGHSHGVHGHCHRCGDHEH